MKKRAASVVIIVSAIGWWLTLPPPPQPVSSTTPPPEVMPKIISPPIKQDEIPVVIEELPSLPDFSSLSEEEVHQTPEALIQAGEVVHRLIATAEEEPIKRRAVLNSLLTCAANADYPAALRALCYREGLNGMQRWDEALSLSDYAIPVEIQTLAQKATN